MDFGDLTLPISYDWFLLLSRLLFAGLFIIFLWRVLATISRESLSAAPAGHAALNLLDESGRVIGTFRLSRRRPSTIGRDPTNDIVLTDRSVSGHHAVIQRYEQEWVLTDLQSRNGTLVNGAVLTGETGITAGDVVQFGAIRAQFAFDESVF
jgi:pSer/pThr/pTyr-binding forkhead associated (FHA) protein